MTLWSRFIAWIDRDLGDEGWPDMRSWSSLTPIVPLVLVVPPLFYFDPPETVRIWVGAIAALPTFLLFGVWSWRVFVATRRQIGRIKADRTER